MSELNITPTNDNTTSNITQLLNSFNKFNLILANTAWVKTTSVEDIKTIFKLGSFIENASKRLSSQNALDEFVGLQKSQSGIEDNTNINYLCACDCLLKTFFRCENISEVTLDIVIRMYTSMFPKERLQQVLSELIVSSSNLECLSDFINVLPRESVKEFEYRLHFSNWLNLWKHKKDFIKDDIKEQLSGYNLENNLTNFIGILSLKHLSEAEQIVQKLILEIILGKMVDRSILSSSFWYTLLQKINLNVLCYVCENFKDFSNSLLKFIIYLGSMMDKEGEIWKSDPNNTLCPNINFYDLLIVIKSICSLNRKYVLDKLTEAKSDTGSSIWDQIKVEIMEISMNEVVYLS